MPLSTPRSSRYCKSLSSLLSWSKYNPTPPILFVGDDDQFERERCRELQLTLDKLEGRVIVGARGKLQRVGSEDKTLDNVCGLMPMLGDQHIDTSISELKVEGGGFGNLDNKVFGDWATSCEQEPSSELENYGYGDHDLSCDENCDSADVGPMVTRGLTVMTPKNITHPAFSWLPDGKERWETSSRISEDSLFDDHTRQPPEPQFGDAGKAVVRFSFLGAAMETPTTTTPFYKDSLYSKILSEPWSPAPVGLTCFEKAPVDTTRLVEELNTPRTLSCISQFPCSNTLTQAKIAAFEGKPSFIKRVIKAIVQPMKMLASRNIKHHANPFNKDPMKGNPLEEHSGDDNAANPSHSVTSKSAAKKVVFNDKVGYRLFREDSLCAKGY